MPKKRREHRATRAALTAAGVVHKPGLADEMLRELAPFLAEEGVDLNDPDGLDLDTLNAALARATARFNASLPDLPVVGGPPSGGAGAGSPFVKRSASSGVPASGVRDIGSARSASGSASGPGARGRGVSGSRASDRSLVREFERWLGRQAEIAAPSPREESGFFAELLKVAAHYGFDPRTPAGVGHLIDLLAGTEAPDSEGTVDAALEVLHDYVHFQQETNGEPVAWVDVHDQLEAAIVEDSFPGASILDAALADSDLLDEDVRRTALAGTVLCARVGELLEWIGRGRKVAPSGGVQRVDIAHAAGLLGIAAIGAAKPSTDAPDAPALLEVEGGPETPAASAIRARAMKDVPLLPSWWMALGGADLIRVNGTRVVAGPSAADWSAGSLPPLELAETVVGLTVAGFICEDLQHRPARFADEVTGFILGRLLNALAPGEVETPEYDNDFDRLLDARALHALRYLVDVGVLEPDGTGDVVVPEGLRGTVARGVAAAVTMLGGVPED